MPGVLADTASYGLSCIMLLLHPMLHAASDCPYPFAARRSNAGAPALAARGHQVLQAARLHGEHGRSIRCARIQPGPIAGQGQMPHRTV